MWISTVFKCSVSESKTKKIKKAYTIFFTISVIFLRVVCLLPLKRVSSQLKTKIWLFYQHVRDRKPLNGCFYVSVCLSFTNTYKLASLIAKSFAVLLTASLITVWLPRVVLTHAHIHIGCLFPPKHLINGVNRLMRCRHIRISLIRFQCVLWGELLMLEVKQSCSFHAVHHFFC